MVQVALYPLCVMGESDPPKVIPYLLIQAPLYCTLVSTLTTYSLVSQAELKGKHMTKKNDLKWRLKDLPDAVDVAELVDKKVITPEEARDLLFSDGKNNTKEELEALKEQIKFQQDTINKLIDKLNSTSTHWNYIQTYEPKYPTRYWLNTTVTCGNMSVSDSNVTYSANSVS